MCFLVWPRFQSFVSVVFWAPLSNSTIWPLLPNPTKNITQPFSLCFPSVLTARSLSSEDHHEAARTRAVGGRKALGDFPGGNAAEGVYVFFFWGGCETLCWYFGLYFEKTDWNTLVTKHFFSWSGRFRLASRRAFTFVVWNSMKRMFWLAKHLTEACWSFFGFGRMEANHRFNELLEELGIDPPNRNILVFHGFPSSPDFRRLPQQPTSEFC